MIQQLEELCLKKELLTKLLHDIDGNNTFDVEDVDILKKCITDVDMHISQLKHVLNENMFKNMRDRIDARSILLEQHEPVLEKCPELLEFFARKQLLLQTEIDEKMQLLTRTST